MKKLINKLFEWLGYVPKEKSIEKRVSWAHKAVFNHQTGIYHVVELKDNYLVALLEEYGYTYFPIKMFAFNGDKKSARLCAEGLCEMLNQKI